MKRFKVHTEGINTYGFRVLTSGIDMTEFKDNPVGYYNHAESLVELDDRVKVMPICMWNNLEVNSSGEMFAVPEFDMDDELGKKVAGKVQRGFLRGASIGIEILEWSDDPKYLLVGQRYPTVVKSRMREISVVDIPGNKGCLTLYDSTGKRLNLSGNGTNDAALFDEIGMKKLVDEVKEFVADELEQLDLPIHNTPTDMEELKQIAGFLGLAQTATLADVQGKINEIKTGVAEVATLKSRIKELEDAGKAARDKEIASLLDAAVTENRITAAQRPAYVALFEKDFDNTKTIIESLPKAVTLGDFAKSDTSTGEMKYQGKTFGELSKEKPEVLAKLKDNDPATFKALFKAEYGREYRETAK